VEMHEYHFVASDSGIDRKLSSSITPHCQGRNQNFFAFFPSLFPLFLPFLFSFLRIEVAPQFSEGFGEALLALPQHGRTIFAATKHVLWLRAFIPPTAMTLPFTLLSVFSPPHTSPFFLSLPPSPTRPFPLHSLAFPFHPSFP